MSNKLLNHFNNKYYISQFFQVLALKFIKTKMEYLSDTQLICLIRIAFYRENVEKLLLFHKYVEQREIENKMHRQFYLQVKFAKIFEITLDKNICSFKNEKS